MSRPLWALSAGARQAQALDMAADAAKLKKVREKMKLRSIMGKTNINSKKF